MPGSRKAAARKMLAQACRNQQLPWTRPPPVHVRNGESLALKKIELWIKGMRLHGIPRAGIARSCARGARKL